MKTIRPVELQELRQANQPVEILDLRPHVDFENAHIDGAHSLPVTEISPEGVLLSRQLLATEPLYLVSQSGAFAQLSAYELEHRAWTNSSSWPVACRPGSKTDYPP